MEISNNIKFLPEDFSSVIVRSDLETALANIINEIRSTTNPRNYNLLLSINQLKQYNADYCGKNGKIATQNIQEIYNIYQQIIKVSMEMRKLLSDKISLEIYDNIKYAFYINGKRYSTEELRLDWLVLRNGGLYINLNRTVEEELKKGLENTAQQRLAEIFNNHYLSYLAAITGMYKGKNGIGAGSAINKGHVAEAYEGHIAEHHSESYQLLNATKMNSTVLDKIQGRIVLDKEIEGANEKDWWAIHEDPNEAWRHIRAARGTQRGTVAGDVGAYQVKQIQDNSGSVALTSLTNLELGIKNYCMITNPDIPVSQVAHQIALYLSESVSAKDREVQAFLANQQVAPIINNFKNTKIAHL